MNNLRFFPGSHTSRAALLTIVGLLVGSRAQGQSIQVVETTPDAAQLLAPQPSINFVPGASTELPIAIDDTVRYQKLEGAGGSFTDSAAYLVWTKLTATQRAAVMQDLFSPSGIHLSFLRQPMGATDLALSSYTYDDLPAGETDPGMRQFSIAHDQAYILPAIKAALAVNPAIKVLALPWSPPAWMKTGASLNGGTVNTADFPALANYFAHFVQAYESNGVPIQYVAVQNEPLNENTGYPTTFMNPVDEGSFISQYLGPQLKQMRLKNRGWNFLDQNTDPTDATPGILGYEHNWDNPKYPELLLGNAAVRPYLAGVSFHCYAGNVADAQNAVHDLDSGAPIYYTECTGGSYAPDFAVNLANGLETQVIGVLRNWGKTVMEWNLALDPTGGPTVENGCQGCRGVLTVDPSTTPATVTRNVEYYVLGHLTKYVQAGAYRISSTDYGHGSIEDVAFKNPDGSIAVLVLNSAASPSTFNLNWSGQTASYTLPAGAAATFFWAAHPAGTFDVTTSLPAETVRPGEGTRFQVAVNTYGFASKESLAKAVGVELHGLPSGAYGELVPAGPPNLYLLPIDSLPDAAAGTYPVTVVGTRGMEQSSSTVQLTIGGKETPFGGTAWPLPGLVQAEDFDNGGNFVGYFNLDATNQGGSTYRGSATVGVQPTGDTGGGYDVGYTKEGEYLRYTVDVNAAGLYNLQARVASSGPGGYYHVSFLEKNTGQYANESLAENKTGTLFVPQTGDFQMYQTMVSPFFLLAPGRYVMQVTLDGNGPTGGMGNFNWFALQTPAASASFTGTPQAIPGQIEAENFDTGGKGAAYWNGAASNGGGANYRPGETVYIENSSDTGSGYDVGQTNPGDWLNYSVSIAQARAYTLSVRVANGVGGGAFHLAVDGTSITKSISVPETGGYQSWQTIRIPDVPLPAGRHTLQLVMETGGFYNAVGNFNWFSLE